METPELDPENEEIVVFFRTKQVPQWTPFTIMKGGTTLNLLVKALKGSPLGKERIKNTIRGNVAKALYRDEDNMLDEIRNAGSGNYKYAKEFEWAFKVRDKDVPEDWHKADSVILVPPKD